MREGGIDTQANGGFSNGHGESRVKWRSTRHTSWRPISIKVTEVSSLGATIHAARSGMGEKQPTPGERDDAQNNTHWAIAA